MKPEVVVVDYGIGNLLSVCRAFDHCGTKVTLTDDPQRIENADCTVVPGVGAFGDCMRALRSRDLIEPVKSAALSGRPFLGICVGMQMMLDVSEEFGVHEGLGLIPGRVVEIPSRKNDGTVRKVPHIGWNRLQSGSKDTVWDRSILSGVNHGCSVYFVHSFNAQPTNESCRLADTNHDGVRVSALIASENMYGCQFHPEKSGPIGLKILQRFVDIS